MKRRNIGLFFTFLSVCFVNSQADDTTVDSVASPVPTAPTAADESVEVPVATSEPVKKAENIDLKDIVNTPLAVPDVMDTETSQASGDTVVEPALSPTPAAEQPNDSVATDDPKEAAPSVGDPEGETLTLEQKVDEAVEAEVNAEPDTTVEASPTDTAEESNFISKIAKELAQQPPQESLFLLDSEVPPGTSTRLGWSPRISFMGISAPSAVLVLNGVNKGPTLCLTAAVHGDELNGIEIVRRVLYDIDPQELSGAVIGVPIVNIQGFRRSSRYLPDRRDLNRFFPGNPTGSSAARIAHSFFSEVITHCDLLVDLHTGSFRRTNLPQIRADLGYPEVASLTEKMGSIVVVQSEGAQGSLRRAAVEHGIPAITLEAGAPHELQRDAVEYGVKSVETAMDGLDMIDRRRFWERAVEPVYYQSVWVRAKEGGILFSEVDLGAYVKEGMVLGVITDPITNSRSEIKAPFDGRVIGMALNQVMFPGFAAYHVGLKASVEEAAQESTVLTEAAAEVPAEGSEGDGSDQQALPLTDEAVMVDGVSDEDSE